MTAKNFPSVIIEPEQSAQYAIIWLHGLGADGTDFAPIVPLLALPKDISIRFVFPHAPVQCVSIMGGYPTRAWYDILEISSTAKEDLNSIAKAEATIRQLIIEQNQLGIPSERIILAGFSQGGATALYCGLRYPETLAGLMGLSAYLPAAQVLETSLAVANQETPIFLAHGTQDKLVPMAMGLRIQEFLKKHHYEASWHTYAMEHSVCDDELGDLSRWISRIVTA